MWGSASSSCAFSAPLAGCPASLLWRILATCPAGGWEAHRPRVLLFKEEETNIWEVAVTGLRGLQAAVPGAGVAGLGVIPVRDGFPVSPKPTASRGSRTLISFPRGDRGLGGCASGAPQQPPKPQCAPLASSGPGFRPRLIVCSHALTSPPRSCPHHGQNSTGSVFFPTRLSDSG